MSVALHIASGFMDRFVQFSSAELKQVQKAMRLIMDNPATPGLRRHRLERVKAEGLYSYAPNKNLRIISFEPDNRNIYLLHVDHHDRAYQWAEVRRVDLSDSTSGSIRIVTSEARTEDIAKENQEAARSVLDKDFTDLLPERRPGHSYLFDPLKDGQLISVGVTPLYVALARRIRNDDDLLFLMDHLPTSLAEILFGLAQTIISHYGNSSEQEQAELRSESSASPEVDSSPINTVADDAALTEWIKHLDDALRKPFDAWRTFLHPSQRKAVETLSKGPFRVTGGAGTGKTVVGLHRAKLLSTRGFDRVNVLTFNRTLMKNLRRSVASLLDGQNASGIRVATFHEFVADLIRRTGAKVNFETTTDVFFRCQAPIRASDLGLTDTEIMHALVAHEAVQVIGPSGARSLEDYLRAPRRGIRRLDNGKREKLWGYFESCWASAVSEGRIPYEFASLFLLRHGAQALANAALIVDEVQDLSTTDLVLLARLAPGPDQLTLLEDAKQRIYGAGYSLKDLGINVMGRRTLHLTMNYRTTAAIAKMASKPVQALGVKTIDLPRSLRTGTEPEVRSFGEVDAEIAWIGKTIVAAQARGKTRIAVLARFKRQLDRLSEGLTKANVNHTVLDRTRSSDEADGVVLCTIHSSKGLEFEVVFVIGLEDSMDRPWVPVSERFDPAAVADAERREVHLLYVAMTRARDELYVTGHGDVCGLVQIKAA